MIQKLRSVKNKNFYIVGKLIQHDDLASITKNIEDSGGKVVHTLSKADYLVINDNSSNLSVIQKAKEMQVPVISEITLTLMIQGGD